MSLRKAALALACFTATSAGLAQSSSAKKEVYFTCKCSDDVGQLYATAFRDLVASSPRYKLAATAQEEDSKRKITSMSWHVSTISLDDSYGDQGHSAVLSVAILIGKSYYVTHVVQTCGRDVVAKCAASTLSSLDDAIYNP